MTMKVEKENVLNETPKMEKPTAPTPKAPQPPKPSFKDVPGWIKGIVGVLAVVILFAVVSVLVYASGGAGNVLVRAAASVIPYPAVKVNDQTVRMSEYFREYDALVNYFDQISEGEELPPQEELQMTIVDTLVNKIAVQQLAKKHGIEFDVARVEEFFQTISGQGDDATAFAEEIKSTFGWTPEEFKERIVHPIVTATQLQEFVSKDVMLQSAAREKVEAAYTRLESGEEFVDVAKEVNLDSGALIETDLGYQNQSELSPIWKEDVEALEKGEYTKVIELPDGFVVLQLADRIAAGDDDQLQLFVMLVPKVAVEDVTDEFLETAEVKRYIGEES